MSVEATALSPLDLQPSTLQVSQPRPLRRSEASDYIIETYGFPCSTKTLSKMAVTGDGPRFYMAGRFAMYDKSDLDAWAKARLGRKIGSTAELKGEAA